MEVLRRGAFNSRPCKKSRCSSVHHCCLSVHLSASVYLPCNWKWLFGWHSWDERGDHMGLDWPVVWIKHRTWLPHQQTTQIAVHNLSSTCTWTVPVFPTLLQTNTMKANSNTVVVTRGVIRPNCQSSLSISRNLSTSRTAMEYGTIGTPKYVDSIRTALLRLEEAFHPSIDVVFFGRTVHQLRCNFSQCREPFAGFACKQSTSDIVARIIVVSRKWNHTPLRQQVALVMPRHRYLFISQCSLYFTLEWFCRFTALTWTMPCDSNWKFRILFFIERYNRRILFKHWLPVSLILRFAGDS